MLVLSTKCLANILVEFINEWLDSHPTKFLGKSSKLIRKMKNSRKFNISTKVISKWRGFEEILKNFRDKKKRFVTNIRQIIFSNEHIDLEKKKIYKFYYFFFHNPNQHDRKLFPAAFLYKFMQKFSLIFKTLPNSLQKTTTLNAAYLKTQSLFIFFCNITTNYQKSLHAPEF